MDKEYLPKIKKKVNNSYGKIFKHDRLSSYSIIIKLNYKNIIFPISFFRIIINFFIANQFNCVILLFSRNENERYNNINLLN